MHVAKRIVSLVFVSSVDARRRAKRRRADAKEAMEQLKALNQSAAAAYQDGDFDKTKSQLQEAITLAKENGLSSNRMMAQVYILFGVLKINEHKDTDAGVRYFAKAIDISPAVKIPPTMATKAVKAAFAKAEDVDPSTLGDLGEAEAAPAAKKPSKKEAAKEAAAAAADQGAGEAGEGREGCRGRRREEAAGGGPQAGRGRAQAGRGGAQAGRRRHKSDARRSSSMIWRRPE